MIQNGALNVEYPITENYSMELILWPWQDSQDKQNELIADLCDKIKATLFTVERNNSLHTSRKTG